MMNFDVDGIREKFILKKRSRVLTFREISNDIGVSPSALCRFYNDTEGYKVDLDTLYKIASWCGVKVMDLEAAVSMNKDTLSQIRDLIQNDKLLNDLSKEKLINLFEAMYNSLRN
jgi:transcriptional regulator with XRE-family HTH domain